MKIRLLVIIFSFLLLATGYLGYRLLKESRCRVELVSNSKLLRVSVSDKKEFTNFVYNYLPCNTDKGGFRVGSIENKDSNEVYVKKITININDENWSYQMKRRLSSESEIYSKIFSWNYNINEKESQVVLNLQYGDVLVNGSDFDQVFMFLMANSLDVIKRFDKIANEKESIYILNRDNFYYGLQSAGISYERL